MANRLSPSGFPLLMSCVGSYRAQQAYPDETNAAAEEGTRAHEHAALLLRSKYEGSTGFNTGTEMDAHVQLYVDHVVSIVGDGKPHIEEKMSIKSLHPNAKGTPDCWWYDEVKNELHVWDFKYGFGPVEVEENWQLMGYASGVLQLIIKSIPTEIKRELRIHFHIVQPRARHPDGPIRTWVLWQGNYQDYRRSLKRNIALAHQPNAPFTAGEHCRYCRARLNCEEFKKTSNILALSVDTTPSTELSPGLIGAELTELERSAKIIDYRITTLKDEAEKILKSGGFVAGFKLKPSFSRDKWAEEPWRIELNFKAQGIEMPTVGDVITPAQAKKAGLDITMLTKRDFLGDRVVVDKDVIEIDWESAE